MSETLHPPRIYGEEIVITKTEKEYEIVPAHEKKGEAGSYWQTFPLQARVYIQESEEGWGGYKGKTKFLHTQPPGNAFWIRTRGLETFEDRELLGRNHTIYPDGSLNPPELLEALQFVEEELGYEIDIEVLKALRIDDKSLEAFF